MAARDPERWRRDVLRDTGLTILTGPLRFAVPLAGYLVLYPLILSRSGMSVLGIWSLLASAVLWVGLADIGFSSLLAREAGRDRAAAELETVRADHLAAKRAYVVLFLPVVLLVYLLLAPLLAPWTSVYPPEALRASATLLLLGAVLQLTAKLDAAILCARQDNSFVQAVSIVAPIFLFGTAIVGAALSRPLEGLAAGTFLSGLVMRSAYSRRLARGHPEWRLARVEVAWLESLRGACTLARRGWHLYTASLGMLLREPSFRFVIAFSLGLPAAATYDIAMRVARSARDVLAAGFSVLYPSLSIFHRSDDRAHTIALVRLSLLVLLPSGAAVLGLVLGATHAVLALWLQDVPEQLVGATRILALWSMLTLANVPFWFLLQATHNERYASRSIWVHTACILLVAPLSQFVELELIPLLVYWTVTAAATQVLIYSSVQSRLSLFWPIVLTPRVVTALGSSFAFVLLALAVSMREPSGAVGMPPYLLPALAVFLGLALAIVWHPLLGFARAARVVS
jgi:O-antigen/teichoic acid export membrane protein